MKRISFLHYFMKGIRLSAAVVFVVMTISMFSITVASGVLRYQFYSYDIVKNSNIKNSVYVMCDVDFTLNAEEITDTVSEITGRLQSYDCVNSILAVKTVNTFMYAEQYVSILLYSDEMLDAFPIRSTPKTDPELLKRSGINPIAVVSGTKIFDDTKAVQYTLQMMSKGKKEGILVEPIAELRYPYLPVTFGGGSSNMVAGDIIAATQCLIAYESPELLEYFKENADVTMSPNFFVVFDPDSAKAEYDEVISDILSVGSFVSYDDMVDNTVGEIYENLKRMLPLPAFFVFITLLSLLSISVITIYKKMYEVSVYYIYGLGKRGVNACFVCYMGLIYLFALIPNLIFILCFERIREGQWLDFDFFIIDSFSIVYNLVFVAVLMLISILVPLVMMRKNTPIMMLRRMEE